MAGAKQQAAINGPPSQFNIYLLSAARFYVITLQKIIDEVSYKTKEELLHGLRQGSDSAFAEVCRRYTRPLFSFCYSYTRDSAYTEEIVQDVLIALWNYRSKLTDDGSLDTIIYTIARHHAVNAFRKNINSPIYEDYVDYKDSLSVNDNDNLEYEEFVRRVYAAIDRLTPAQRQVVTLSKLHNLSNPEIALKLGVSEKTVRNQLTSGLSSLRKILALSIIIHLFTS